MMAHADTGLAEVAEPRIALEPTQSGVEFGFEKLFYEAANARPHPISKGSNQSSQRNCSPSAELGVGIVLFVAMA